MLKKSATIIATGSLLALAGTAFVSTAAVAAEPVEACSVWHQGDTYNVAVQEIAERTYSVTIADFKNLASESSHSDSYIPLPLTPVDLRMSHNVVKLNPALTVSHIAISQSVQTGPNEDFTGAQIEAYNRLSPAPWESVSLNGDEIVWAQDMDARSDENGVMVLPSDYPFAGLGFDDAAGVLEFTVTVPDDVDGEVSLFDGMSIDFTSSKISALDGVWEPDQPHSSAFPGCTVSIEPVPETKPELKPEPKPEPGTTRPAEREPLANTGSGEYSLLLGFASAAAVAGGTMAFVGRRQKRAN
ncbi:hypothetical protein QBL02_07040 [Leucobacter sp. UT-8R-CII-1-4]|uniref:hypothetical protein n=1 Tax=Leucobacter sp. UT-8R-CII-1-4 TaxID=3040075 RepID=UPI0024A7A8D4|nr:hypothetical protein [Leucobacter sp. UT-8R-CII-1-4]MDI6023298.1 hypothetical protein [Leucobacter sp. UT-8R-CII-1-4]